VSIFFRRTFLKGIEVGLLCALLQSCSHIEVNDRDFIVSPEQQLIKSLVDEFIIPQYASLMAAQLQLNKQAKLYCRADESGPEMYIKPLHDSWKASLASWQKIQVVRFGPIKRDNRDWQMLFYPDSKNLVRRKSRELLLENAELTAEVMQDASVVLQGLASIEYQLFDENFLNGTDKRQRCRLLMAVTKHQYDLGKTLYQEWSNDYRSILLTPGVVNEVYSNELQVLGELIGSLVGQLEEMKINKMGSPLGLKSKKPSLKPYLLESWRSGQSLNNIHNNLLSVQLIFDVSIKDYLDAIDRKELRKALQWEIESLIEFVESQNDSLFMLLQNKDADYIRQLYSKTGVLITMIKTKLVPTMNVTLGFNSNDGD